MTMSLHAVALFRARGGRAAAVHHGLLHQLGVLPGDSSLNPQP